MTLAVLVACFVAGCLGGEDIPETETDISILSDDEAAGEALATDLKQIIEKEEYGARAKSITVNELVQPGAVVLVIEIPDFFNNRDYLNRMLDISIDVMREAEGNPEIGRVTFDFKGPLNSGGVARFCLFDGITGEGRTWEDLRTYPEPVDAIRAGFDVKNILPGLIKE